MLWWEDDVEAHALRRRGWSISAIARHLGHDRKTVRAYLGGEREQGRRRDGARTSWGRSSITAGSGWLMIRACGRRRCWMSCGNWGTGGRIRA